MFQPGIYTSLTPAEVRERIHAEGFDPIQIEDPPGHHYPAHRHVETKLLAFLQGGMTVTVAGKVYGCLAGDRLLIPGDTEHAAQVDADGCVYLWSEKRL